MVLLQTRRKHSHLVLEHANCNFKYLIEKLNRKNPLLMGMSTNA